MEEVEVSVHRSHKRRCCPLATGPHSVVSLHHTNQTLQDPGFLLVKDSYWQFEINLASAKLEFDLKILDFEKDLGCFYSQDFEIFEICEILTFILKVT